MNLSETDEEVSQYVDSQHPEILLISNNHSKPSQIVKEKSTQVLSNRKSNIQERKDGMTNLKKSLKEPNKCIPKSKKTTKLQ